MKSFSASTTCLLGALLHLSLISLVDSLNCYQCDSSEDIRCSEELTSRDLRALPCDTLSEPRFCVKMTGIFGGNLGAKRFCSERFLDNYCTYVQRPGDQREYRSCVYTCTGDGCNGSTNLSAAHWMLLVSLVAGATSHLIHQRF